MTARDEAPGTGTQEQLPLPVDEEPIPFTLTARAKRTVAPDSLPDLAVVGADGRRWPADPDGQDTRPAQARALRRAGVSWAEIADELDVDELLARAWVEGVTPVHSARQRREAPGRRASDSGLDRTAHQAFEAARDQARRDLDRHRADLVSAGLGLLAGVIEVDPPAVVVATGDRALGGAAMRWLAEVVELDQHRVRAVLRLAPQVAGDQAADEWREALGLPGLRLATTRWSSAPHPQATELLLRITDPGVAGAVAGWRDALLQQLSAAGAATPARDDWPALGA